MQASYISLCRGVMAALGCPWALTAAVPEDWLCGCGAPADVQGLALTPTSTGRAEEWLFDKLLAPVKANATAKTMAALAAAAVALAPASPGGGAAASNGTAACSGPSCGAGASSSNGTATPCSGSGCGASTSGNGSSAACSGTNCGGSTSGGGSNSSSSGSSGGASACTGASCGGGSSSGGGGSGGGSGGGGDSSCPSCASMPSMALPASAFFDASRFSVTPSTFVLNASNPAQAVEIYALDDGISNGAAVVYLSFPLLPALTTAPAWLATTAVVPGHLFYSIDTHSAGIALKANCASGSSGSCLTPADAPGAFVITDAPGAYALFTATLSSSPPAGATVVLSFVGLSPALTVSIGSAPSATSTVMTAAVVAPSLAITANNWRSGVTFRVSASAATFAVGGALPITLSAPGWGNASQVLTFVRLATLAPRAFAPASVRQGGDAATAVLALPALPAGLPLSLSLWLDVSAAPLAALARSVSLAHAEAADKLPTVLPFAPWGLVASFSGPMASTNASALLAFAMTGLASSGESVRFCAQIVDPALHVALQPPACSSPPTMLLDAHVAAIGGVAAIPLADAAGAAWLADNTTLRLVEGQLTALTLALTTDVAGRVTLSAQELRLNASAPSLAAVVTAVGYISNSSAQRSVQLLVRGAAPAPGAAPFDASDMSRRGQIMLRAQATATAGQPFDSGYATAKYKVLNFVLVSSASGGPVTAAVQPAMTVTAPPQAQLAKGAVTATPITVSLSPYPAAGRSVAVLVALPAGAAAMAPGPLASAATGLVTLTFVGANLAAGTPPPPAMLYVSVPSDGIVAEPRSFKSFSFAVDAAATTDPLYLATPATNLVLPATDATQPQLVLAGVGAAGGAAATLSLTEGGASASFTVALSVGMPAGASVNVSVSAATGACQRPGTPLPALSTACFSNSDCVAPATCAQPGTAQWLKAAVSSPQVLFFTASSWSVPQLVTVVAPADLVAEGAHGGLVRLRVTAGSGAFLAAQAASVLVGIVDVDVAGASFAALSTGPLANALYEGAASNYGRATAWTTPLAPVSFTALVTDPRAQVTIAAQWPDFGKVLFAVADDSVARGSGASNAFNVSLRVTLRSADPAYDGLVLLQPLTVVDNDVAALNATVLRASAGEAGTPASFAVSLTSQPTQRVAVSLAERAPATPYANSSLFSDACAAFPATGSQLLPLDAADVSLTPVVAAAFFDERNWWVPQVLQVAARADARVEGAMSVSVGVSVASADAAYAALAPAAGRVAISEELLADPPALPRVKLANDYNSITLTFAAPFATVRDTTAGTATAAPVGCAQLFTVFAASAAAPPASRTCAAFGALNPAELAASAAALGAGARCDQTSATTITVRLGQGATLAAGDRLQFVAGRLRATPQALRSLAGSAVVADADVPATPSIVLAGGAASTTLSLCQVMAIAAKVAGTGGRPFSVMWIATPTGASAGGALASGLVDELARANAARSPNLVLDAGRLPPGAAVRLDVTVSNFVGRTATASVTVSRQAAATPELSLPAALAALRSQGVSASVRALLPACAGAAGNTSDASGGAANSLAFYWYETSGLLSASLGSAAGVPAGDATFTPPSGGLLLAVGGSGRALSLDGASLPAAAASYAFTVFAVPRRQPALFGRASTVVAVALDPLSAAIAGGAQASLQAGADLSLDASASGEPTATLRATQSGIAFAWACVLAEDGVSACPGLDLSAAAAATLTVAGASLAAGTGYTFTVTVSGAGRAPASASQTVAVSSVATPALALYTSAVFVQGSASVVTNNLLVLEASALLAADPAASFWYSWSAHAGIFVDAALLDSFAGSAIVALDPAADLAAGADYTICVTASSAAPDLASSGTACQSFSTAAQPSLGPASVTLAEAGSATFLVGVATAAGVDRLRFTYATEATCAFYAALANADVAGYVPVATDYLGAMQAVADAGGPSSQAFSLFDSRDSATTAVATALLPAGDIVVCVFGSAASGAAVAQCAAAAVAAVQLSSGAATTLLDSAAQSGEPAQTLGALNYVVSAQSSASVPAPAAPAAAGTRRLSSDAAVAASLLSTLQAAFTQTSGGTGSELAAVAASLLNAAPSIAAQANASMSGDCAALARNVLGAMVAAGQALPDATLGAVAASLATCGASTSQTVAALAGPVSGGTFAGSFHLSGLGGAAGANGEVGGASGLSRASVALARAGAVVSSALGALATATAANPAMVCATGADVPAPLARAGGTARVANLSLPIEVQVSGLPARAAGDRSPFVTIAFASVAGAPAADSGSVVAAVFTDPATGAASHAGVVVQAPAGGGGPGAAYTLLATHNSTFTLVLEPGCGIIAAASGSGAAITATTVAEGAARYVYVRLQSAPDADVVVAAALPSGVCYVTASNLMAASGGLAATCSTGADCAALQDCRAQLATVAPASLTFSAANWASAQALLVSGTVDHVDESEASVVGSLVLTPSSADSRFDALGVCADAGCTTHVGNAGASVDVRVLDTDAAAVVVGAPSAASVLESAAGAPVTYTLRLASAPAGDVSVALVSNSTSLTASPASVTFSRLSWAAPQTVTLAPVNDDLVNGPRAASVSQAVSSSADAKYAAASAAAVFVTVLDDDVAGLVLGAASPAFIDSSGAAAVATMTLALTAQPAAVVTVTLSPSSSRPFLLTLSGAGVAAGSYDVTIEPADWSTPVALTWTSEAGAASGNAAVTITPSVASSDTAFAAVSAAALALLTRGFTIIDAGAAGIVPALASSPLALAEGANATFTLTLQAPPSSAVTLQLSARVGDAASPFAVPFAVVPASLTFEVGQEKVPQTVTLVGAQDRVAYPAALAFSVLVAVAAGGAGADAAYAAAAPLSVAVAWADDDVPALSLLPASLDLSAGGSGTLTVALATEPVTSVTVWLSAAAGASLSAASVVLDAGSWEAGLPVTISADQGVAHGAQAAVTAASGGAGAGDYASFAVAPVQALAALPLPSPTPSATATPTPSPTGTPTTTPSLSGTPTTTPSLTGSPSSTPSLTGSPSSTPSLTGTPTTTPSASPTPSASASPSASATASPSPSQLPVVRFALALSNVDAALFTGDAAPAAAVRAQLAASIAAAAGGGVAAADITITKITDTTSGTVVWALSARRLAGPAKAAAVAAAAAAARLLPATAQLSVESRINAPSLAAAAALGASLAADTAGFAARVTTSLAAGDAATFGAASVTVSAASISAPSAPLPIASGGGGSGGAAAAISGGAVAGIAIGVVVIIVGAIIYAARRKRHGASHRAAAAAVSNDHRPAASAAAAAAAAPSLGASMMPNPTSASKGRHAPSLSREEAGSAQT